MVATRGYVDIIKIEGDTYITTTQRGDQVCENLLPDLIAYTTLSYMAPTLMESDIVGYVFKMRKGVKPQFFRDNANLRMVAEKLVDNISEISLPFKEEIKTLYDEPLQP